MTTVVGKTRPLFVSKCMTSMNVKMSGFFGSELPNDDGNATSSTSSSDDEDSLSETEITCEKEAPQPSKKMISALEAFQEVEGPPSFLDLDGYERKAQLDKKRKSIGDDSPSKDEEVEKKKQRPIVIRAEPVKYTISQTSEALAISTSKESKTTGSKAMEVSEFLIKGGGAMLPRKTKVQRDKEKSKREKGQSSHSQWKSEEEMLLRQQYD